MVPPRKLWKNATGHRRGIVVDDMTPIDAPTHYRRPPISISQSETSMRDTTPLATPKSSPLSPLPTAPPPLPMESHGSKSPGFYEDDSDDGKVRGGSVDSEDPKYLVTLEDGNVVSVADSPDARKRRQNTIAARRSRQRKLDYVRSLETQVAELEKERDELKARSEKAEEKVQWLKEMLMDGRGASGND